MLKWIFQPTYSVHTLGWYGAALGLSDAVRKDSGFWTAMAVFFAVVFVGALLDTLGRWLTTRKEKTQ